MLVVWQATNQNLSSLLEFRGSSEQRGDRPSKNPSQ